MKNIEGFTLVELLAVIVILAIILAIAVPGITGIINSATAGSFESDAKMVLQQLAYEQLKNDSFDPTTINESNIASINLSNNNYASMDIGMKDNKLYVIIVGKDKWANLKACGTMQDMKVVAADDSTTCETLDQAAIQANAPVLATGMTPIKWDGTTWVDTTTSDTDWYNYNTIDKKWANVRTADGSMWVWIPRYIYRISSGWHSSTTGTIDVKFSLGTSDTNSGVTLDESTGSSASNNKWTNHPAFWWDNDSDGVRETGEELTGIWVAKFEPTAVEGLDSSSTVCVAGDNVTTKTIKIIPDVASWRCINMGNAFTVSRNMETNTAYGWDGSSSGIDTHLMKDVEWGAMAYLSKSIYGQSTNEIWINPNQDYITGCAGDSESAAATTSCNSYSTSNGVKASTTGNVYGIYDTSGGARERVSAYINNNDTSLNTYGSSIISANNKYKDIYSIGTGDNQADNYNAAIDTKGNAIYETSSNISGSYSWFGDYTYMPNTTNPWFVRGGGPTSTTSAGAFYLGYTSGNQYAGYGFRPVLIVGTGI